MPEAAELIKEDHRKVEQLFDRYKGGDTSVVRQVCMELTVHTAIEEQVLYPALADVPDGDRLRQEAEHEHQEVKDAIAQIEQDGSASDDIERCMQTIMEGVTHHVQEEESEVLPKMQEGLGAERMTALGDQLMQAKRQQMVATGAIADMTKQELYHLAQTADIPGRSDMNKDQLIEALRS